MGLQNVQVRCAGRGLRSAAGRGAHDVVVTRALAALPVVVGVLAFRLLESGGTMVAMKGAISNEERIQAQKALDILGGGRLGSRSSWSRSRGPRTAGSIWRRKESGHSAGTSFTAAGQGSPRGGRLGGGLRLRQKLRG